MDESKLKISLNEESIESLVYKKLKNKAKNPLIKSIIRVEIDKEDVVIRMKFTFKDINIKIEGEIYREFSFSADEGIDEKELRDVLERDINSICHPLFSKASKLVADISNEVFLFPLIVPPNEWLEHEESDYKFI
ncbi:TPA: hypothetical protein ACSP9O_001094 [Staphylococcus aureus]|uniref:hypothetical protein n=1 Tax=Mammaliicoccus sciuri TaxID=1296 RepID=UPI002978ED8F|nr:hypothetical protein [Mammaliicoccus sciuri]MDW4480966.1 hypothetical protein [Staphylococcus saprophyticus]MEB6288266.1 hypothetical protein [Mammaliicoccus sciuri]